MAKARKKPKISFPFVEVDWEDIVSDDAWVGAENLPEPAKMHTRAFLVKETTRAIYLAATLDIAQPPHVNFGEVITIPKGCVLKMRKVRR